MIQLTIAFLPSPPHNGFYLGPLFVHAYGLAYVVTVIAAVTITVRRWEARGGSRDLVYEVALWGFPAGVIGGRLYFLATSWSEVLPHWWGAFAIWDGGLGIWGGIALGTLAGIWRLRRHRADIPVFMDAAAPGLLVAQAIGRVGNYFNQELFGGPTKLPWALEISPAHRPVGYLQYATFQPTFLYELIWNLLRADHAQERHEFTGRCADQPYRAVDARPPRPSLAAAVLVAATCRLKADRCAVGADLTGPRLTTLVYG
jgi:prolipoprotein diacylglyceryl transferase